MPADDVDELYALPLDEFVTARNRLAKERGDPALKKLRKPSVAAWHVNQLARSQPAGVRGLVDAAAGVRAAQQRAVSGARTGGSDLRAATRAHRDALEGLVDAVPANLVERVRSTLAAASLDEERVDDLVAGRLVDDVEPAGFGDLAGLELPAFAEDDDEDGGDAAPAPEPDPRAEERARVERELDAARAGLDRAYDAVRDAERAVADLEARRADLTP